MSGNDPMNDPDLRRQMYKYFGSEAEREDTRIHDLFHYGPYTGPVVTFLRQHRWWLLIGLAALVIVATSR